MMNGNDDWPEFTEALKAWLSGAGEEALTVAYERGRRTVTEGGSMLGIAAAYRSALIEVLGENPQSDPIGLLTDAEPFLFESLSSFDMSQRAVAEANGILRRLNHMLEDEASRVAHSLHDHAGSILASARMQLDLAARDLPADVLQRLEQVRQLLDQTGEQLRHLSHELRPMVLDDLGLMPALEYLAHGVQGRTGLNVIVSGQLDRRPLPAVELAVYRAIQEALNNIVLHAGDVSLARVRVERRRPDELSCFVEDDGCGFDPDVVLEDKSRSGMGLAGIRERIHAIGGTFSIQSAPDAGTLVFLRIPVTSWQ